MEAGLRNPRIAIVGASESQMVEIKALMAANKIDIVKPHKADATVDADWILSTVNEVVKRQGVVDYLEKTISDKSCEVSNYSNGEDSHGRSGSRGKGGKIKYRRT